MPSDYFSSWARSSKTESVNPYLKEGGMPEWMRKTIKEVEVKAATDAERTTICECIMVVLGARFSQVPESLADKVRAIDDMDILKILLKKSAKAAAADDVIRFVDELNR